MRTKMTAWYDTENDRPLFGIKVFVNGGWANLSENRKALLFETEQECEVKRKEVRRWRYDSSSMTEAEAEILSSPAPQTLGV